MNSFAYEILFGLSIVGTVFFVPIATGIWILRPLDLAAKFKRKPTRFTILDFFGLVFLVQIPMALVHATLSRDDETLLYWVFMVLGWIASVAVWAMAVKTFSNAGIEAVWTRAALVFFVLPMAYMGTFAVVVIAFLMAGFARSSSPLVLAALVALEMFLVANLIAAGIYTRRVAPPEWRHAGQGDSPFGDLP